MKKIVLLMGIAIAFASCAKDTVKETNRGRAIDFRVAAETRATEITTANLQTFYVTALKGAESYFTDVAFTKVDNYFHSSPSYFWPGDKSYLNFYAYAPGASDLGVTAKIDNVDKKLIGFSPAWNVEDQTDFVTATATGNIDDETNGVALTFKHQLAQIEVKAKNANAGYVYTIAGVKIVNVGTKADYNFEPDSENGEQAWTLYDGETGAYEVQSNYSTVLDSYAQNIMRTEGDNFMLIPQQLTEWKPDVEGDKGAYIAVLAKIYTAGGAEVFPKDGLNEYGWMAIPVGTNWEAGYKYVYTLDFTNGAGYPEGDPDPIYGDPIKFTMEVTPWEENATVEATASKIVGTWNLKRIEVTNYWDDGDVTKQVIDDAEGIADMTPERFLTITVLDENTYVVYPGDEEHQEIHPFSITDNYLFVPELTDDDGNPVSEMFIREISDNFMTFSDTYRYSGRTFERINYYVRIADIEVNTEINNAKKN